MTIRDKVLAVIEQVASEQDKKLPPLDDKLRLIESRTGFARAGRGGRTPRGSVGNRPV